MEVDYTWRGEFTSAELNKLHAEAFDTRVFGDEEWNWRQQVETHSFGWVVARDGDGTIIGFINVISDGLVHAWLQDVMVAVAVRHRGIGRRVVAAATEATRAAGYEWLHVDFDDDLRGFYIDTCGFAPTSAGLIEL
jgi:GNAT superfamily N-acetyltransferase